MGVMELRPYQKEAYDSILANWQSGVKHTLVVMVTGSGKTILFANIAKTLVGQGERVLILAHRGELLDQAKDKLQKATGLGAALEKADQSCIGKWERVVVGSVQTLEREPRLQRFSPDYFNTIIIDEAHHVMSDGYQKVIEHFPNAKLLGVTATPDRGDMKDLGQVFESLAYEYPLTRAIKEGYLCRIMAQTIPLQIDLGSIHVQSGDYALGEVDAAIEPYLEAIATEMETYCKDRHTVVFLPLIKTSQKMRDILNQHGFRAAEVNGQSQDRDQILEDFAARKYNVLCNSMLLTEGWDCPIVDCIVCLRPTKIRSLYVQIVGRGTRLAPGKDHLLLLDFLWQTTRHDLVKPASLVARTREVEDKLSDKLDGDDEALDLMDAEEDANRDVVAEREAALAKQLEEMRKRQRKLVDPLQYAMSIEDSILADYEPVLPWEMAPPSEKQLDMLEKRGINPDAIKNSGMASKIIDKLISRTKAGLATPKQIRELEKRGFESVGTWSFTDASNMISRIANNRWRVPYDIDPSTYKPDAGGDAFTW